MPDGVDKGGGERPLYIRNSISDFGIAAAVIDRRGWVRASTPLRAASPPWGRR